MPEERKERQLITYSDTHAYFIPGEMDDNSNPDNQKIDIGNVWTGLQWYQAFNNDTGPLTREQKADLILEIFKEPNDLLSLAWTVELQTGTEGLIQAVVDSFSWADWKIAPQLGGTTEAVYLKPHISVCVSVGDKPLTAMSIRKVEWDEDKKDLICLSPKFHIYRENGGELKEIEDDEHDILPEFNLRFVEILPGNRIRLEGTEDWGDDEELDDPKRVYLSYVLSSRGELGFESREKIDRSIALRVLAKKSGGPFSIIPDKDTFDWKGTREKITKDRMARKVLAHFLLPYCDMPTTDGHYYILPEEIVNNSD